MTASSGQSVRCTHYLPRVRLAEGGVVRMALNVCAALAGAGNEVTLLTADPADLPPEWRGSGGSGAPRVVTLPAARRALRWPGAQVRDLLRDTQVLHLHAPWHPANVRFARLARSMGIPYVVTAHGMLDDWSIARHRWRKLAYLNLFGRRLLENAARVHCTGEVEAQQSRRRFPRGRAAVVPLPLDVAAYEVLPGPEAARRAFPAVGRPGLKILFLSRLVPGKGVELLIRALVILRGRGVDARLLVAGDADREYRAALERLVAETRMQQHVAFLGMVGGVEKVSLYESADVFVLASEHENFGLVIPEAMACRTPAVFTRGVGIWPELERAGGVVVDDTPDAVAAAVEALLKDPQRRRELGERGRRWALEALSPRHLTRQYEALYREVIAEGASRSAAPRGGAAAAAAAAPAGGSER